MNRIAAWALAAVMALNAAHSTTNHTTTNNTTPNRVPVHQQVQTALRAEIDYNKEDEPMKKSVYTILMAAMCAASLTLTGCGGDGEGTTVTTTTTTSTTTIATTTTTGGAETTYITVTGEDGAAVTDADGAAVTSAIAIDPATTATDAATTAADTTTTTTTTTATPVVVTTQAPVAQPTTTSTTAAPTTTTAADTRPTVMWEAMNMPIYCNYDDPWEYPYDVEACLADCKAYVESKGLTWDASLTLEGTTWAGNISTVAYSAYGFNLKQDANGASVFGKIDLEASNWGVTTINVIWMPDDKAPFEGCYEIYVVY